MFTIEKHIHSHYLEHLNWQIYKKEVKTLLSRTATFYYAGCL